MFENHRRYHILDAIRGIAAIVVVVYHCQEHIGVSPLPGYLAVDLFFSLSGFVIARAYQDRLASGLSLSDFMKIRFVRLYPLIALGITFGAAAAILNQSYSWAHLAALIVLNAMLIPTSGGSLYLLNIPVWSLFYEIIANLVYASTAWRWRLGRLLILALISSLVLMIGSVLLDSLDLGTRLKNLPIGFARVAFSFAVGVIISHIRPWGPVPSCNLALLPIGMVIAIFVAPVPSYLLLQYSIVIVLVVFPLLLWASTSMDLAVKYHRLAGWLGDISYPLYTLHYPLILLFIPIQIRKLSYFPIIILFTLFAIVVAGVTERFFDAPIRARLSRLTRTSASEMPKIVGS